MAKSPDAFRTIGEVSDALDTPAHVLRFWESKFTQVKPVKRAGGRRYYRPDDMALLGGLRVLLHDQGLTIKGAQKVLRENGVKHVADMGLAAFAEDRSDTIDHATAPQAGPLHRRADAADRPALLASIARLSPVAIARRAGKLGPLVVRLERLHSRLTHGG